MSAVQWISRTVTRDGFALGFAIGVLPHAVVELLSHPSLGTALVPGLLLLVLIGERR